MPSDLVVSVKQIGSYPPLNPVTGSEVLLCQSGGLGGPYYSVTMQNMIVNTLSNFGGPVGIGVGSLPPDAAGDTLFSGDIVASPGVLGYAFNAYRYNTSGSKYWQTGPAGMFEMDPATGNLNWFSAPSQPGGLVIDNPGVTPGGPGSLWFNTMSLSPLGELTVPQQVTVGRNPNAAMELVTYGMFNSTVQSMVITWNGRFGNVTLNLNDITTAGGAPNASPNLQGIPTAPTPNLGNNSNQIATTAWVLNQITSVTAGVASWNGRSGIVTFQAADLAAVGGLTTNQANALYLSLAGGTMTGPITMTAGANQNMEVPVLGQVGARVGASTPPATPAPLSGNLWWDSNGAQLYAWTGAQWVVAVNPPIPNTANFLPISGGTITGPLQVMGQITASASLAVTGSASVFGAAYTVPSPVATGTILGARLGATINLAVAGYNDGTNYRQLPGTGTSSATPLGPVFIGSSASNLGLYWNPPGADNAIFTPNAVAVFGTAGATIVGGLTLSPVNNAGLNMNNGGIYGGANSFFNSLGFLVWGHGQANTATFAFDFQANPGGSGVNYLQCSVSAPLISWSGGFPLCTTIDQQTAYFPAARIWIHQGGLQVQFDSAGGGYALATTTWSSDRRTKTNAQPSSHDALAKVNALTVYEADHHPPGFGDVTQHFDHSWMADEVEKICPNAVIHGLVGDKGEEAEFASLNTQYLVPILWQAVQQLAAKIAALEGAKT